jgi:uncharacterized phage infection (PIP) family protein YhgE
MERLKIHTIQLEKESWENVPGLVFKSFQALSANMANIKRWADRTDERSKVNTEDVKKNQDRLDRFAEEMNVMVQRIDSLDEKVAAKSESNRQQHMDVAAAVRRLDRCLSVLFTNLGQTFDVPMDTAPRSKGESSTESRPPNDDSPARNEEGPSDLTSGEHAVDLAACSLEANLSNIEEVFRRWAENRSRQESHEQALERNLEDLGSSTEKMQERLYTWETMLKESSDAMDFLGQSLARTQGAVHELYSSRVQLHDVDAAISKRSKELEELRMQTELRVDNLTEQFQVHTSEVEHLISEARSQTDEKIEDHSCQVANLVEKHINPVNAYLNTLHVRTDVLRVELDGLSERMPKLASNVEEVASNLQNSIEANAAQTDSFSNQIEEISQSLVQCFDKGDAMHSQLGESIQSIASSLGEKIGSLRDGFQVSAQAIESLKFEDLARLSKDLFNLEQKVAKWVHAHPLPTKISEARLFSLEARLNEEMDARMLFESKVRVRAGPLTPSSPVTPATYGYGGDDLALPQLSSDSSNRSEERRSFQLNVLGAPNSARRMRRSIA